MADELKGGKFTFLDIVLRIAGLVQGGRKRRARALKGLADKKLAQLEATHNLFIRLLTELERVARNASEQLSRSDDTDSVRDAFAETVTKIELVRAEGKESRINDFYEALTFASKTMEDRGFLVTLDVGAAERLRALMSSYAEYFRVDNVYMHELGRALLNTRTSTVVNRIRDKRVDFGKIDLEHAASETEEVARLAIEASREKWKIVTTKYHELNYYLLEQGLV
jgi:hypothetical protein